MNADSATPTPPGSRDSTHPDPAPGATLIRCLDLHTEGEPLRVILDGFPVPPGRTILERRRAAREHHDALRTALMWEPRGHADMYGCLVVPPERPDSDFGVLFLHNQGYSTMCGHGVLAMARAAVELGLVEAVEPETRITMDTPAGPVHACVTLADGGVTAVSFRNVPSWTVGLDRSVELPGLGTVRYDLAFGGAFYAFVDSREVDLPLEPSAVGPLVEAGRSIKAAVQAVDPPHHPGDPDLSFLYGVIFTGPPRHPHHHSRQVCVFADGEVDRSPTGTGVSARLALLRSRDLVSPDRTLTVESITGGRFLCRIVEETEAFGIPAVVPEVEGRAFVTGWSTFHLDPRDPFRDGFLVR